MSDREEYEIWFDYKPNEWPFCWCSYMTIPGHNTYSNLSMTKWGARLGAWRVRRAYRKARRMRKRGRL